MVLQAGNRWSQTWSHNISFSVRTKQKRERIAGLNLYLQKVKATWPRKAPKRKGAPRPTERAPRPFSNLYCVVDDFMVYFPLVSSWWSTFQSIFISFSLFTCCAINLNKSFKIFVAELFIVFAALALQTITPVTFTHFTSPPLIDHLN